LPIYEKKIEDQLDVPLDEYALKFHNTQNWVLRKTTKVKMSSGLDIKVI